MFSFHVLFPIQVIPYFILFLYSDLYGAALKSCVFIGYFYIFKVARLPASFLQLSGNFLQCYALMHHHDNEMV